jgi:hypothetical protein
VVYTDWVSSFPKKGTKRLGYNRTPVVLQEILRAQEEVLQERVGRGTQTEGALTPAASAARDISGRHRALNARRHNGESQTGTCTDSGKEARFTCLLIGL